MTSITSTFWWYFWLLSIVIQGPVPVSVTHKLNLIVFNNQLLAVNFVRVATLPNHPVCTCSSSEDVDIYWYWFIPFDYLFVSGMPFISSSGYVLIHWYICEILMQYEEVCLGYGLRVAWIARLLLVHKCWKAPSTLHCDRREQSVTFWGVGQLWPNPH